MANKENISVNREEFNKLKIKLAEAYKTGYRQGMENGFRHAIDIVIKTMNDLKENEIIKDWCDNVMKDVKEN
jgi:hypothetical protein